MANTSGELVDIFKAKLPGVHIRTNEEPRAMAALRAATASFTNGSTKQLWTWSHANGLEIHKPTEDSDKLTWDIVSFNAGAEFSECLPLIRKITATGDNAQTERDQAGLPNRIVLVLQDARHLFDPERDAGPVYLNYLKAMLYAVRGSGSHIVLTGGDWKVPPEIADQVTLVDLHLPTKDELLDYIQKLADAYGKLTDKLTVDKTVVPALARACCGLTMDEAKNIVSLCIVRHKGITADAVKVAIQHKKQIIARGGILQYEESNKAMADVGGLEILKDWIAKRGKLFSDEARKLGINTPKGLVMVGVPGSGKTLTARAIAAAWNCPLVKMDAGKLMGSLVGQSESNLREALRTAEAVAPCVLMIDEAEKAFGGGGDLDGGTSQRVFGALLSWLQDKTADVFVCVTANNVEKLPPEFLRKGRFDEMFFVDLPDEASRKEILAIHLAKAKAAKLDLGAAVKVSAGFTGAELEAVVQEALIAAFSASRKLKADDLVEAIDDTTPLSTTMGPKIARLREWAKERGVKLASKPLEAKSASPAVRKDSEEFVDVA